MSNYQVGDKFVIEIEEVITGDICNLTPMLYRMKEFHSFAFDKNGLDKLERLDGDYVNENFGELQNEAYETGKNDGRDEVLNWQKGNEEDAYNKGLNDAWKLAKKILLPVGYGGIVIEDLNKMFDVPSTRRASHWILKEFTPQEALAKLEAYEKSKEEIKVGDVVYNSNNNQNAMVLQVNKDRKNATVIELFGDKLQMHTPPLGALIKTGTKIDLFSFLTDAKHTLAEIGKE